MFNLYSIQKRHRLLLLRGRCQFLVIVPLVPQKIRALPNPGHKYLEQQEIEAAKLVWEGSLAPQAWKNVGTGCGWPHQNLIGLVVLSSH